MDETRFRALVEHGHEGITLFDAAGNVLYASPAAVRLLGYTEEEVGRRNALEIVHPEDLPATQELMQRALEMPGAPVPYRHRVRHFDGSWRWIEGTVTNHLERPGLNAMVVNYRDVTERVEAQEALERVVRERDRALAELQEREQRFRTLADSAPVAIWVNGRDGGCEFVNRAYLEFFGKRLEEVLGFGWAPSAHPEDADGYVNAYLEALRERKPFDAQARFMRADGEYRWLQSVGVPRYSATGEFLGYVGSSPDITDVKRAEEEATQALRARDEFLSVAAHELKTPVTSLRGFAQVELRRLGRGGELDRERVERSLRATLEQSDRLTRLVDALLDVSRLSMGRLRLAPEETDLVALVRDAIGRVQADPERHPITVSAPDSLRAVVDPLRIEQVVGNLLENAVRYSPEGGAIEVALRADDRPGPGGVEPSSVVGRRSSGEGPGEWAVISVRDRGLGVPPEHRERIFDRFYQAHAGAPGAASTHAPGLGLGLFISRQLVELHGGRLWAEFPESGGSHFFVELPLRGAAPTG